MKEKRRQQVLVRTALILESWSYLFLAATVVAWLTSGFERELGGVKVSLHNWQKPFGLWIGLTLLRTLISPHPPGLTRSLAGLYSRMARGVALDRPGRAWTVWGVTLGAALGVVLSIHYLYLMPCRSGRIGFVLASSLFGGGVHLLYFHALEALLKRAARFLSAERRSSIAQGLYFLIWSLLCFGPLRSYEPRLTEPMIRQLALGLAIGALLAWLLTARWRLPGRAGLIRRGALYAAVIGALILSAWSGWQDVKMKKPERRPRLRVLFITIDTVRADHLSCYGYGKNTSPELDRLAGRGVRMSRAFCPMGTTEPSHASMLTGAYPRTHGLVDHLQKVTGDVDSMAERFLERGFVTIAVTSRQRMLPADLGVPGFLESTGPHHWAIQTSAPEALRRAANLMVKHRDQDLFVWVHFFDPHKPYQFRPGFSESFVSEDRGPREPDSFLAPDQRYGIKEIEYVRGLYDGEIAYMDHYVGRLIELARELEPVPAEPLLIIVVADHGEALGDYQDKPIRYGFGHGGLVYNAVAHVPFIMSWPGRIPEGAVVDDVAELTDLAPTVLDYALGVTGFPAQGKSLRPVIEGRGDTDQFAVVERRLIEGDEARPWLTLPQYAVIDGNLGWKFIVTGDKMIELYDINNDWAEEQDLSGQSPEAVETMTQELIKWKEITPETRPEERELSPSELEGLRALGYIQ